MSTTLPNQNELASYAPQGGGMLTTFRDLEQMFKFADFLSKSTLLPATFQNNAGNVMIALNMAQRLRMDPLMVCQNIVIVHGNAGISGKMAIALLNRSPKYRRIEYRFANGKDYTGGIQVVGHRADDPEDKAPDYGTPITMEMARAEGWTANKKWQTMPEQMMRYRAAAFFARAFVPEELLGMQTAEELEDVDVASQEIRNVTPTKSGLKLAKPAPAQEKASTVPEETPDQEDKPQKPVTKRKKPVQDAPKPQEAPTDEELLLKEGIEEMESALKWIEKSMKQSGAGWLKVYRVMEAIGFSHPEVGCSREELADFALAIRSDADARKALEESGIVFIAE